jgi:hypothetical protein
VAVEQTKHLHTQHPVLSVVHASPVTHAARPVALASAAIPVAAVVAPVRKVVVDEHTASSHEGESKQEFAAAEHDQPSSNDTSGDGERAATITIGREDGSSHEHSGPSSETNRTETQPTETQSQPAAESQDPSQDTSTTGSTTTTAEVTTQPAPDVALIIGSE